MAKVKEPAPHAKAAQIEKEAVRALSVDDVEEALTKSTYGGMKKLEPLDEDDNIIKDIEAENEQLRKNAKEAERCYHGVRIELMDRNKEITKLKKTVEELRAINEEWAGGKKEDIEVLKAECIALKEENRQLKDSSVQTNNQLRVRDQEVIELKEANETLHAKVADGERECLNLKDDLRVAVAAKTTAQRQLDEAKKTISKMKYAHEEEVRALEDELAEAKVLGKKAGEYSAMLDADSYAFEKILDLTDSLKCQVQAMRGVLGLIGSEVEGHV